MSLAGIIEEEVFIVLNDLQLEPDHFHMTEVKTASSFSTFGQSIAFPPNHSSIPFQKPSPHTVPFNC